MSARLQQTLTSQQREDTVVTLLFDHSGSLRPGRCYLAVAEVAEALADALTNASIATEVLGFTTSRWKGGLARKKWLADGRPALPGRLNDLLHVVHLDGSSGPRVGPHCFPVMREERLFKENIDGEALEWAQERLLENPRRRKVLIIVSDGAPVDDSTLSHNWSAILYDHVKGVSHRIASSTNIVLGGIGIEHSVQNYYSNEAVAKPIAQLAHVAPDFIEKMIAVAHRSPAPAEN
jgi:cobaltochelatase CobT